jgi:hypothetical protein
MVDSSWKGGRVSDHGMKLPAKVVLGLQSQKVKPANSKHKFKTPK